MSARQDLATLCLGLLPQFLGVKDSGLGFFEGAGLRLRILSLGSGV